MAFGMWSKACFCFSFVIWVVSLCFSYRWAGLLECLCFLCVIVFCVFYASAICNLFGVLSCLWMWKPGADRLRGNQSNKQEEARLPDNVFEQTPRICFGVFGIFWDFWDFLKAMRATNSKKLDCHTTYLNKHLEFVRFSDFLVLWRFFKGNQSNKQEEGKASMETKLFFRALPE